MCWGLYGLHHIFCSYFSASHCYSWSIDREGTAPRSTFMFEPLFSGTLQKVKESLMNLLPKCSFLFGNRGELHAFAELMGWTSDSDVDMMRCLATLLPGMAVITAGAEPTMVAVDGDVQLFPVPQSLEQKTGHVVGINKIWRLSKLKPVFWICFQRFWILTYDVHGFVSRQTTRSCESIAFGDLQV